MKDGLGVNRPMPRVRQMIWMRDTHATLGSMSNAILRLLATVAHLRAPEGCPWDREQTPQSLCPYILEESAELVDAIELGDAQAVCEELGDVLLQVVLQAQIYQEAGLFDFEQVCERINQKLIYRHPHVFGEVQVSSSQEVADNWERLKAQERPPEPLSTKLSQLPKDLSSLATCHKISRKVAKVGFEWPDLAGVLAKVHEEIAELEHALAHESKERQSEELGDVFFSLVNVARWQDIDSDTALRETNRRFLKRFQQVEQLATQPLHEYSPAQLESLWQQAKRLTKQASS